MTLHIQLPPQAESILRGAFGSSLDEAALEAIITEGYRTEKLSHYEVQQLLAFSNRLDTDKWLHDHGVMLHYDAADLDEDRESIAKLIHP